MWAAYYHHDICLRIIIEHLEGIVTHKPGNGKIDNRYAVIHGPIVREAARAADKFCMIFRNGQAYLHRLHSTLDILRDKTQYINFHGSFEGSLLYYAVAAAHDQVVEYMFEHDWRVEMLNQPIGEAQRTPVLEAVRWNRRPLFSTLVKHGADIHALAANPFQPRLRNWSILYIFADKGHDKNVSLASTLRVDGSLET